MCDKAKDWWLLSPFMTVTPETKDWTWVLARPCPDCGLDTRALDHSGIPALTRASAAGWQPVLAGDKAADRPSPTRWSPLEYACHVRDTCRLFAYRINLMLTKDNPRFPNWDPDATAVSNHYGEQYPAHVARHLTGAAEHIAALLEKVDGAQWDRPGHRGDGVSFTVDSLSRFFAHEAVHHLWDVTGARHPGR